MTAVFRLCDDYVTRSAALDPVGAGMRGLSTEYGAATDFGPDGNAAREELIASMLAALAAAEASSAEANPAGVNPAGASSGTAPGGRSGGPARCCASTAAPSRTGWSPR